MSDQKLYSEEEVLALMRSTQDHTYAYMELDDDGYWCEPSDTEKEEIFKKILHEESERLWLRLQIQIANEALNEAENETARKREEKRQLEKKLRELED